MLAFFKLVRYPPAMRSLLSALHAERRTLLGCLVILMGAVLLFASLLYAVEHNVQPDKFGTIPQAMWWAIVTLGTVGYGDAVPVTPLGKLVSVFAIVGGLTMIAPPMFTGPRRRGLPIPRRRTRAISPRVKLRKLRRPTAAPGNWAAAGGLSRLRDNIVAAVTAENADSRFSEQGGKVA